MERHPKQIHVRMSEDEVARAKALARSLGMTLSDLIRTLLQMPTSSVGEGGNLIVIDRVTALSSPGRCGGGGTTTTRRYTP